MVEIKRDGQAEKMLVGIYGATTSWLQGDGLACAKGCATCCTQSVTMTSLEGALMVEHLAAQGRLEWLQGLLEQGEFSVPRPMVTTNGFAKACMDQRSVPDEPEWSFAPCVFLKDGICTIYEARPFGCRAFISRIDCGKSGYAEVAPHLVTLNTVVQQVIEHLAQGGVWGNMLDVLAWLLGGGQGQGVLSSLDVPGFLVMPEEKRLVEGYIGRICDEVDGLDWVVGVFGSPPS